MDSSTDDRIPALEDSLLERKKHIRQLMKYFQGPVNIRAENYSATQTWCVYWAAHSLNLLGKNDYLQSKSQDVIEFIRECKNETGGYGGGLGQISHLGTSFAAVNALVSLASEEALESIDRLKMVDFLHRMKQPDGSFTMHDDGEIDSRASYCALAIMRLLNIQDELLLNNVSDWLASCQTYEGGFGSVPGTEAHGGYTFCCVAALCLVNQLERIDMDSLVRWLTAKQMTPEGGFCGRSNKLVDSCYSYWQGAVFPMIHPYFYNSDANQADDNPENKPRTRSRSKLDQESALGSWLMDSQSLQNYILNSCQDQDGLLRDKPGVSPDVYHTCYALSGLSLSQHQPDGNIFDIGDRATNVLCDNNAIFNICPENLEFCMSFFDKRAIIIGKVSKND